MIEQRSGIFCYRRNGYGVFLGQWRRNVNILLPSVPCAVKKRTALRPILVFVVVKQNKRETTLETVRARDWNLADCDNVVVLWMCNPCAC
jgi:hypothetical protein